MPGLPALRRSATYASATVTTMCVCMVDTLVPFGLEVSGAIVPDPGVMVVDHHGAGGAARAMGVRGPRQHPAGKGFLAVAPAWCLLLARKHDQSGTCASDNNSGASDNQADDRLTPPDMVGTHRECGGCLCCVPGVPWRSRLGSDEGEGEHGVGISPHRVAVEPTGGQFDDECGVGGEAVVLPRGGAAGVADQLAHG